VPPLAAGRRLRPPVPLLDPLIEFPFSCTISWAKLEPNRRPESHFRVTLVSHRRPPPLSPRRRHPAPLPEPPAPFMPLDLDPTVQISPRSSQTDLIPVNLSWFCGLALMFSGNQPTVHDSSKVIANRSFLFCLGPCLLLK
jgi:hypothetical protein